MRARDRISLAIGGGALLSSVLIVGSALRWTQLLVGGLVAAALAMQLTSRRRLDRVSPLLVLIAAAVALTAIQLIPLPDAIVAALNPVGAGLRADGAHLAGTTPWSCLSMDPPGTLRALAFLLILLGVASLSLRFASSERGRYYLIAGVVIACGLAAAVTGAHVIAQASSLYGIYAPQHAAPPILGPLLNANHLGCLMAFGTILAIGLAFQDRQAHQLRVLWVVIALACTMVALASESRGAALGLVIGVLTTGALIFGSRLGARQNTRRQKRAALARDLPIALVVGVGLAIAVYTTAGNVADQIDNTTLAEIDHPLSKFEAWKSSVHLVAESPWIGEGRGAVEPTLTRVHDASAYATFSHLENEYVSAVVEWGVPGALILGLLLGWCMVTGMRRWRDGPLAAGALGALAAVMFQSSVDFGIQLLGLAVPVTIVAATLVVVPLRETSQLARIRIYRGLVIAAILGSCAPLLFRATRSLQEDHDAIDADPGVSLATLKDEIQRHPLDYFGFGKTAEHMVADGDPRAIDLLNQALQLHPFHPGLHRLAARMLIGSHRQQAALEYSLAMHGTLFPKELLTEITSVLPKPDEAASAIPPDWEPTDLIMRSLKELKRPDVAIDWLRRVIARPQVDTQLIDTLYQLAMDHNDLAAAEDAAQHRIAFAHTFTSRVMLARVELARGELDPLIKDLADVSTWHTRTDEQGDAWLMLCDAYTKKGRSQDAIVCLHRLDGSGLMFSRRDRILSRLKELEEQHTSEFKLHALTTGPDAAPAPVMPPTSTDNPSSDSSSSTDTPAAPLIPNPLDTSPLAPQP